MLFVFIQTRYVDFMLANDINFDVLIRSSKNTSELFTGAPFNWGFHSPWMEAELAFGDSSCRVFHVEITN